MCSVDFNSQFGMNVKNYQQYQQMRFGTGIRLNTFQNQQLSFDTGLFTANKTNPFNNTSSVGNSLTFNGVQYDNAYSMLNSVGNKEQDKGDYSLKDNIKSLFKEIGSEIKSFAKDVASGVKNFFNKLFGKGKSENSSNVDKAIGDMQNAQDKETLKGAIDGATQEQSQIQGQQSQNAQQLKGLKGQAAQAQKAEDGANSQLQQSNEQLSNNESKLEQAKADYNAALDKVSDAQYAVADAENNLAAAKSAATSENPNTAAIQQAEAQVREAKQAEIQARQELQRAEQAQTQAEQDVNTSKQQVETSENNVAEAEAQTEAVNQQVDTAEAQQVELNTSGEEISQGIGEGNQRLEQMENNQTPVENSEAEAESPASELPSSEQGNITDGSNAFQSQDSLIDSKGYSDDEKAKILQARQDIQNMQPGDTVQCGADVYTMDADGTIRVNDTAGEYKSKEEAAMNAGDSAMRQIDSRKREAFEMSFYK